MLSKSNFTLNLNKKCKKQCNFTKKNRIIQSKKFSDVSRLHGSIRKLKNKLTFIIFRNCLLTSKKFVKIKNNQIEKNIYLSTVLTLKKDFLILLKKVWTIFNFKEFKETMQTVIINLDWCEKCLMRGRTNYLTKTVT